MAFFCPYEHYVPHDFVIYKISAHVFHDVMAIVPLENAKNGRTHLIKNKSAVVNPTGWSRGILDQGCCCCCWLLDGLLLADGTVGGSARFRRSRCRWQRSATVVVPPRWLVEVEPIGQLAETRPGPRFRFLAGWWCCCCCCCCRCCCCRRRLSHPLETDG